MWNASCAIFLARARGYFVSTVGRDEEAIRTYIKNQEIADKQLDQLQLKLASS
jgi:putative transposase